MQPNLLLLCLSLQSVGIQVYATMPSFPQVLKTESFVPDSIAIMLDKLILPTIISGKIKFCSFQGKLLNKF